LLRSARTAFKFAEGAFEQITRLADYGVEVDRFQTGGFQPAEDEQLPGQRGTTLCRFPDAFDICLSWVVWRQRISHHAAITENDGE